MSTFDTHAYLSRIGYNGPTVATLQTLSDLHRAHQMTVPFENLDIHLGRDIVLDEARIVAKIVSQRRGGYCYEVNGGFAALLRMLGYSVTLLSAGVRRDDGSFGPEFDHLLLRVDLNEPWLADVSTFVEPIRLANDIQYDSRDSYRLDTDGPYLTLMKAGSDDEWSAKFRFTLDSWQLRDFEGMNQVQQTSPDSHFTRSRICSRLTADGRISLTDGRLIVSHRGTRQEIALADDAAFNDALLDHFGIVLPER